MKISDRLNKVIEYAIDDIQGQGVHKATRRTDYSGRGMFGKSCVTIVTSASSAYLIARLVDQINTLEYYDYDMLDEFSHFIENMKRDKMACSSVYYFPDYHV